MDRIRSSSLKNIRRPARRRAQKAIMQRQNARKQQDLQNDSDEDKWNAYTRRVRKMFRPNAREPVQAVEDNETTDHPMTSSPSDHSSSHSFNDDQVQDVGHIGQCSASSPLDNVHDIDKNPQPYVTTVEVHVSENRNTNDVTPHLREWAVEAVENGVSLSTITELLRILRPALPYLPTDAIALLAMPAHPAGCNVQESRRDQEKSENEKYRGIYKTLKNDLKRTMDSGLERMENRLEASLDEVKAEMRRLKFKTDNLANNMLRDSASKPTERVIMDIRDFLPAKSEKDLLRLEKMLRHDSYEQALVTHLRSIGGMSETYFVKRMMATVMASDLATQYNWAGRGSKKPFSALKTCIIIKDAAKSANITESATEEVIKSWLKYSGDRDGGRKRRMERKSASSEIRLFDLPVCNNSSGDKN